MHFLKKTALFTLSLAFFACASQKPKGHFEAEKAPRSPDFSKLESWAAHPSKRDSADQDLPLLGIRDGQKMAQADVFFVHPTTLLGSGKGEAIWNGDVFNEKLNRKTDAGAIRYQASIFNSAGRVFSPRYRQMNIQGFYEKKGREKDWKAAMQVAHADVLAAFEYYLKNENGGRPIILAGHSQGAYHILELLKSHFDGKPLQKKLVAAYVVGWPVKKDELKNIKPCEKSDDLGCICSWRTVQRGWENPKWLAGPDILVTNPLDWTNQVGRCCPKTANSGAILLKFKKYDTFCDAEVSPNGYLWVGRPKFRGSVLLRTKNYHPGDLNFFYFNVRQNAEERLKKYLLLYSYE